MPDGSMRVVKVGGSLVEPAILSGQLRAWLRLMPPQPTVFVTGGGIWADQIRALDARRGLRAEDAHTLAIRAMSLTAWLLAVCYPELVHLGCLRELQRQFLASRNGTRTAAPLWVLDVAAALRDEESERLPDRLPTGWHVTSDSIAAHLARRLNARELVLLKSCPPPPGPLEDLVAEGYVDAYFAQAVSRRTTWRCVSLPDAIREASG